MCGPWGRGAHLLRAPVRPRRSRCTSCVRRAPLSGGPCSTQPPSPTQLEEEFLVRTEGPRVLPLWIRSSWQACPRGPLEQRPQGSRRRQLHHSPCTPSRPASRCQEGAGPLHQRSEEGRPGRGLLLHLLPAPPEDPLKLRWPDLNVLAMPPRTDIRPSCQVRTAVGPGWSSRRGQDAAPAREGCPA